MKRTPPHSSSAAETLRRPWRVFTHNSTSLCTKSRRSVAARSPVNSQPGAPADSISHAASAIPAKNGGVRTAVSAPDSVRSLAMSALHSARALRDVSTPRRDSTITSAPTRLGSELIVL